MVYQCELCNIKISSERLLEEHNAGKKHLQKLEYQDKLKEISKRSIFLSNFHNTINVSTIENSLNLYGEIVRIITDKQNSLYAIVEFKNADVAQNLLRSFKKIQIGEVVFLELKSLVNLTRF